MKQKHAIKGLFNFSRKLPTGKYEKFTLTELKDNLLTLVHCTLATPTHEIASEGIPLLVNKKIEHKFSDGVVYKGNVISVVPGFPHWYNVQYENDSAVYAYNLFEDYKNGDLKIKLSLTVRTWIVCCKYSCTYSSQHILSFCR